MAAIQVAIDVIFRGTVTVSVSGAPGNIRDYVALYLPGAANYFDWRYVANGLIGIRALAGSTDGTVKFANLIAGNYEVKLYSLTDAGVATLLQTAQLTVAPPESSLASGGGYGVGSFGTTPWDVTEVGSEAYRTLSNGVVISNYAVIGWGKFINDTFFSALNNLMDRVTVLEA